MQNAFGNPQHVLLLGGTSDIGLAIVRAFDLSSLRRVVLACRDTAKGELQAKALRSDKLAVDVVEFRAVGRRSLRGLLEGRLRRGAQGLRSTPGGAPRLRKSSGPHFHPAVRLPKTRWPGD